MSSYSDYQEMCRERLIRANLDPRGIVCPHCGMYIVDRKSKAGRMYGICSVCYEKIKAEVYRQQQAETRARREYDQLRQDCHRGKKKLSDDNGLTARYYE